MRDLLLLSGMYLTQFRNRLLNPTKEAVIKNFLVLVFAAFFFPVVYQLFYFMFKHFYETPVIGPLLVNKLLSAFFMTFSVMIILSSIVSAIPVLYLSRDMDFLFSAPVGIESIFTTQCAKITSGASWMVVLMSVPIFAAYMNVLRTGMAKYLFILLSQVPFCVLLSCVGIIITIMLVRYFPAENVRNTALGFLGIFAAGMVVYFRMLQPEKLTGASFSQVNEFLQGLRTPESAWLPHTNLLRIVKEVTSGGVYAGLRDLFWYFSAGVIMFALAIAAARRFYFEGYGRKGSFRKEKPLSKNYKYERRAFFLSQVSKDLKYLVRDTSQWIQVVFLFGLVFIYLFNIYKLPADLYGLKDFIFFLNIAFIGLILSAVGARFVLPVISNEGRSFWIFKSAPITMARYVMYKFLVYSVPLILTGQTVALISIRMLGSSGFINYVTLYSTFFVTLVIASVGAGFGAFFADFNIKNPESLITGAAGLAYMFVSFIYIAAVLALESGAVREFYISRLVRAMKFSPAGYALNFALVAVIAVAVSAAALWAGVNKLNNMEI